MHYAQAQHRVHARKRLFRRAAVSASFALAACLLSPVIFAETFHIVYPRPSDIADQRAEFAKSVIALAMKKAHAAYTIEPTRDVMERPRALRELADGDTINLHWTSMSASDEPGLRPIHIPLHRGLIGYRVLVIRKERQPEFDRIDTLEQLKALTGGQGFGWVDVGILRDAGLTIETSTYDLLFDMTEAGRIDYFPRGVIEAYTELDSRKATHPDLAVERHLLIVYRSDFIFYTNKRNERLARTLERGLAAAYDDGSYLRLFNSHPYIRNALARADLAGRTIIRIPNRYLSDEDRRIPSRYWFDE